MPNKKIDPKLQLLQKVQREASSKVEKRAIKGARIRESLLGCKAEETSEIKFEYQLKGLDILPAERAREILASVGNKRYSETQHNFRIDNLGDWTNYSILLRWPGDYTSNVDSIAMRGRNTGQGSIKVEVSFLRPKTLLASSKRDLENEAQGIYDCICSLV